MFKPNPLVLPNSKAIRPISESDPAHYDQGMDTQLSDTTATLSDVKKVVKRFVEQRQWQQFHSPKNISMALAIEAAELMEHFQWISMQESRDAATDPEKMAAIGEELADVFCYAIALANEMNIDLAATFEKKMAKNRQKYPVEEIKGRFGHDDPSPVQD